jgi:hypothetical protein
MAKIVIGIHGLGNKPPRVLLRKWWIDAIHEGFRRIGLNRSLVNFELVYWANYIHPVPLNPDEMDHEDPLYLEEPYLPSDVIKPHLEKSNKKKMLSLLEKQMDKLLLNEDLTINFASIGDLIIHHFFRDLEIYYTPPDANLNDVSNDIRNELKNALIKYKNHDILLLAHSMGTIVAYEVLQELKEDVKIDTFVTCGSPLGIPVIMSKIFNRLKSKYPEIKQLYVPESISNQWINISDLDDRVAINYDLADDYPANSRGIHIEDFQVYNDYTNKKKANPHKLYGYLRTPEMAQVLIDFLDRDRNRLRLWIGHLLQPFFRLFKRSM